MNYYGAADLANAFRTVRDNTILIAEDIGEDKYGFQPAPDTRTVAQTLIHIALVPRLQLQVQKVEKITSLGTFDFMTFFGGLLAQEQTPATKAEIIAMLKAGRDEFGGFLDTLTDEFLGERVQMPAGMQGSKSRFEMLMGVKEHEMHHRAQLMQMERMLGIVPHLTRQMQARFAAMASKG